MNDEPSEDMERLWKEANERYEDNTALRAAITVIPYIGSAMDTLIASEGQKIFKARIERLISQLQEETKSINEEAISQDYLHSEEFFDLIIGVFDAAVKTSDREKIKLYARLLTESTVQVKRDEGHFPEDYLNVLSTLSPKQIEIARSLFKSRPGIKDEEWELWENTICYNAGIHKEDLPLMLSQLSSAGLLEHVTSDGTWGSVAQPLQGRYRVTLSFERLMQFLEQKRA